ncbi:hypothetical protein A7982_13180 [Minicystis rosea]|nr:hypothetical protein A7982_13180 [Minicystis rosea]
MLPLTGSSCHVRDVAATSFLRAMPAGARHRDHRRASSDQHLLAIICAGARLNGSQRFSTRLNQ